MNKKDQLEWIRECDFWVFTFSLKFVEYLSIKNISKNPRTRFKI